jgi:leucyl aminopeptidase
MRFDPFALPALHQLTTLSQLKLLPEAVTVVFATPTEVEAPTALKTPLMTALKAIKFKAELATSALLTIEAGKKPCPVLVIGLGKDAPTAASLRKAVATATLTLADMGHKQVQLVLPEAAQTDKHLAEQCLLALQGATYQFGDFKKDGIKQRAHKIAVYGKAVTPALLSRVEKIVTALHTTRRYIDTPPNHMTTTTLRDAALRLAKEHKCITVEVLDKAKLQKLGFGLVLGVSAASAQPPFVVVIKYTPVAKQAPVALVGKGLVFDTGGLQIKTDMGMKGMKCDMGGAATVLGIIKAAASLGVQQNIVGILGIVENAIGPNATRADDIMRAYNGQHVEMGHTDAEGRLVLADCLSYAREFNPTAIFDFATLTGSIMRALGYKFAGLFSSDSKLTEALLKSAAENGEGLWNMPMVEAEDAYGFGIKSEVADLINIDVSKAVPDCTAAALFLHNFVKTAPKVKGKVPAYAHFDIAGTATESLDVTERKTKADAATGYGIRTVLHYLENK